MPSLFNIPVMQPSNVMERVWQEDMLKILEQPLRFILQGIKAIKKCSITCPHIINYTLKQKCGLGIPGILKNMLFKWTEPIYTPICSHILKCNLSFFRFEIKHFLIKIINNRASAGSVFCGMGPGANFHFNTANNVKQI